MQVRSGRSEQSPLRSKFFQTAKGNEYLRPNDDVVRHLVSRLSWQLQYREMPVALDIYVTVAASRRYGRIRCISMDLELFVILKVLSTQISGAMQ